MLPSNMPLNEANVKRILEMGHSRVPVHRPGNRQDIIGTPDERRPAVVQVCLSVLSMCLV
jgi:CBS domain containing-hemolysin-like protein